MLFVLVFVVLAVCRRHCSPLFHRHRVFIFLVLPILVVKVSETKSTGALGSLQH